MFNIVSFSPADSRDGAPERTQLEVQRQHRLKMILKNDRTNSNWTLVGKERAIQNMPKIRKTENAAYTRKNVKNMPLFLVAAAVGCEGSRSREEAKIPDSRLKQKEDFDVATKQFLDFECSTL